MGPFSHIWRWLQGRALLVALWAMRRFARLRVQSAVVLDEQGHRIRDFTASLRKACRLLKPTPALLHNIARVFAPYVNGYVLVRYRWHGRTLRLAFPAEALPAGPPAPVQASWDHHDVTETMRSLRMGSHALEPPALRAVLLHEHGRRDTGQPLRELRVVPSREPPCVSVRVHETPLDLP